MELDFFLILFLYKTFALAVDNEKYEFCANLKCENNLKTRVCGIREEGKGFRLKLFESECALLQFGCRVENEYAYGLTDIEYCKKSFAENYNVSEESSNEISVTETPKTGGKPDHCFAYNCNNTLDSVEVCGIRSDEAGFRIRSFPNKCELLKYNCEKSLNFSDTDFYICDSLQHEQIFDDIIEEATIFFKEDTTTIIDNTQTLPDATTFFEEDTTTIMDNAQTQGETTTKIPQLINIKKLPKNVVLVDGSMLNYNGNINETMDNFFASTHVNSLSMASLNASQLNDTTRRMLIKVAGPVKVFKPWIVIPKKIKTDPMHEPTLSSCFHKCPTECPDTYAPVCGVPGIVAREPSLMFKNHCFMDAAQCKMRWEDKGSTSESSAYIESSFVICLGEQLNGLYRFLPLVRSLQHMGRLKKKGHFRYKMRNMRFFNHLLAREPNVMG